MLEPGGKRVSRMELRLLAWLLTSMNINIVCVWLGAFLMSSPVPSWRHLEISLGVFCTARSRDHRAKPGMFSLGHRNSDPEAPRSVKVTSAQRMLQRWQQ